MMPIMFLQEKSDAFQLFKRYLARVEKETCKSLKHLRYDRGGDFISNKFNILCNDRGIKRYMSAPRTPPQNGINERRNRSIMDYTRTLMMEKNVS
jgi:transposase InsO family protein